MAKLGTHKNLKEKKFGRLTAVRYSGNKQKRY
jgi:hypothetical protein